MRTTATYHIPLRGLKMLRAASPFPPPLPFSRFRFFSSARLVECCLRLPEEKQATAITYIKPEEAQRAETVTVLRWRNKSKGDGKGIETIACCL